LFSGQWRRALSGTCLDQAGDLLKPAGGDAAPTTDGEAAASHEDAARENLPQDRGP
jgi:hypothetical protein